jgi:hypothetical protein
MIQRIFFGGKSARQSVKIHHQPLLAPIIYLNHTCVKGIIILISKQFNDVLINEQLLGRRQTTHDGNREVCGLTV